MDKQFDRRGAGCALQAAVIAGFVFCVPLSGQASDFPFRPDPRLDPAKVNVLSAADADRTGEFQLKSPLSHLKAEVIDWKSADQSLRWTVEVPETADYAVTALLRVDTQAPIKIKVSTDGGEITAPFVRDPAGFQGRSAFAAPLRLTAGRHVVALRLQPSPEQAPFSAEIVSLELARPDVVAALHKEALATRVDVRWMGKAPLGVMFHWTKRTMPRMGPQKPYDQAVKDFDVERFADQVASTGAGFVVLTTSHSDQYLPAPNKALDAILPGRTASRDLVADLISALGKRNIKLFLYYHLGPIEDPAWTAATHEWDKDQTRFFANWQAIISEMGQRYGTGLAGWWFDDGLYNYYYRSPDWSALNRAAHAGNPQRAVCFNSWNGTLATEFQDYDCGEEVAPGGLNAFLDSDGSLNGTLARGGDGRIQAGAFKGLQSASTFVVETDWIHNKRDTEAAAPKWTPQTLASTLSMIKAHGGTPIVDMLIYQDGQIAPNSLETLREATKIAGLR